MNTNSLLRSKSEKMRLSDYLDEYTLCSVALGARATTSTRNRIEIEQMAIGMGFYISLTKEGKVSVDQNTFFCFGAGSIGEAMCFMLAKKGAKRIFITDINNSRAKALAEDINQCFSSVAKPVPHGDFSKLSACTVILNASGLGGKKSIGHSPLSEQYMHSSQLFFDPCFDPAKTRFLLNAEAVGGQILNGQCMAQYQASFQAKLMKSSKVIF